MLKQINQEKFKSTLEENNVVLVDFYADWCGPCKALHPTLEKLANDFEGKAEVVKINVDKNPELSASLGVRSIPALFYFKDGKVVNQQVGMQSLGVLSDNLNKIIEN